MTDAKDNNGTNSTSVACRICGKKTPPSNSSRPKEYCGDHCRNFYKYLSAMDRELDHITFEDHAHAKRVKGDLFSIINNLHKKYPKEKNE